MVYKFGNFETEIDNTDLDLLEKCAAASKRLSDVSLTGDVLEIIAGGCEAVDNFFNDIFGEGAAEKMFGSRRSLRERMTAAMALLDAVNDTSEISALISEFAVRQGGKA